MKPLCSELDKIAKAGKRNGYTKYYVQALLYLLRHTGRCANTFVA